MKPIFKCELCGFTDSDPQKVMNCENQHFKAEDAKVIKTGSYSTNWPLPRYLTVQFPDGSQVEYSYDRVTQKGGDSK